VRDPFPGLPPRRAETPLTAKNRSHSATRDNTDRYSIATRTIACPIARRYRSPRQANICHQQIIERKIAPAAERRRKKRGTPVHAHIVCACIFAGDTSESNDNFESERSVSRLRDTAARAGGIGFSARTQRARRPFRSREFGQLKRTDGPTEVKWKLRPAIFEELVGALLKRNARWCHVLLRKRNGKARGHHAAMLLRSPIAARSISHTALR